MEYKALSQNTIKIVKEYTLNGSVDFSDPLHPICRNIKYTYGATGTENQGISTMQPHSSSTLFSGSNIDFSNFNVSGNQITPNVIGYEIDGVTYYGIKNAYFQVVYSPSYKYIIKGKIKVVKLIPSENAINVEEWNINISGSTTSNSPYGYIRIPKNIDDLILSITFEPSEE